MKQEYDMKKIQNKLHNHTEDLVLETLERLLEEEEFDYVCTCDKCLLDMATYALNRLPAKYIVSYKGNLYTKIDEFEQQVNVDIITTVTRAIKVVAKNPHPDDKI